MFQNTFLFKAEWYPVVFIYWIFLIYLSIYKHLGCFHLLATMNQAAMKMSVQISLWDSIFISFNGYSELELLDHVVNFIFNYLNNAILFSIAVAPFYNPTNSLWEFQFFCSHESVQFSHSVVSDSLRPHELQHTRPPSPSPTPGVHPNPCPLSRWCHPTISSSVVPFSSCPQSFPASGSFQMSQLFTSGSQRIGVSASTSVLPMNTQDWSPLGWTGWISFQSKGLSGIFSTTIIQKHQFFCTQLSL